MAQLQFTAKVKTGLLLELPSEAESLHLTPGDNIGVQLDVASMRTDTQEEKDPTIALLESWIALAPTEPEAVREAEDDLREFKRNLNAPRKESGARLHFPEVE